MLAARSWSRLLVLLALPLTIVGQRPPARLPAGVKVERNLDYVKDGHERNKLDLYLPEMADKPLPVVVWIHGGAWKAGSKDRCPVAALSGKGYAVASINYRLLQHGDFPAQIEDCKAALRWLRASAKKYNLDGEHIGVMGHSAGGHLSGLLGTSGDIKDLEGKGGNAEQSSRVQAAVVIAGPLGIPSRNRTQGNMLTHITKDDPPFLIVHGEDDTTVRFSQGERLNEALKKAGLDVTFVPKKGAGHVGTVFYDADAMKQYQEFFDKHLKKTAPK